METVNNKQDNHDLMTRPMDPGPMDQVMKKLMIHLISLFLMECHMMNDDNDDDNDEEVDDSPDLTVADGVSYVPLD